ncbi:MAG: TonB-dependent receptor [Paludibacteraceae bacterium]|nr:TonB-dependent receptor [Paludibacteraceae bacterium]
MNKITASGLIGLSLLSLQANANESVEGETQILNPVVVTGTGTSHYAEKSPVSVSVLDAEELKHIGATNLQDALQQLTTSITSQTNGMGTFINFNGISDNYVLILVNGQRVSGDDRWNRTSIDNIQRIEVFSGAASSLYGSDAVAGVINIITKDDLQKTQASSYTKVLSHQRFNQDLNVSYKAKKFSGSTSFNHRQADNWQNNHYQEFDEGSQKVLKLTGRPMSTGFKSENIGQYLKWQFNDKWNLSLRGNYYDYRTTRPKNATYYIQKSTKDSTGTKLYNYTAKKAYTYDLHHQSYDYGARVEWKPTDKIQWELDAHCDNFSSKYDYWQTETEEAKEETRKRTRFVTENLRGTIQLTQRNQLTTGLEFVQEHLESETDNIASENAGSSSVFVQDEVQATRWLDALAGLRYTYNSNFGSNLTPDIGLFAHHKGIQFRASYAAGYKTPTLSQLYATDQAKTAARYTINNPDLKPEKSDFWNISLAYSHKRLKASATAFINKIRDMVNYRTIAQAEIDNSIQLTSLYNEGWTTIRQRSNIDQAEIRGANLSLKFFLPAGFIVGGSYTFTDTEAETLTLNTATQAYETSRTPVDKSVKNAGQLNVTWGKKWDRYTLNICLNGYAQDKRYSTTYGYAPGYGQWDIGARYSVRYDHFTLEPGIGIENLFDKRDCSFWNSNYSTINPGRSLFVSLALKFNE